MIKIISDSLSLRSDSFHNNYKSFVAVSPVKILLIVFAALVFVFLSAFPCRGADNDEIMKIYTAGKALYDQGKYQEAVIEYQKGLELSRKTGSKKKMLAFLSSMGMAYQKAGSLKEAEKALSEGATLAGEEGASEMEAWLNQEAGYVNFDLKDYKKSAEHFEKALKYADVNKDTETQSEIHGKLGDTLSKLGRITEANEYFLKALVHAREKKNKQKEMYYLGNIGLNYTYLGKNLKGLEYLEQAIRLGEELKDKANLAMWFATAANLLFEMGNYEKSLDYYKKAMGNAQAVNDRIGESLILRSLGSSYYGLGKYKDAVAHYENALIIVREMGDIPAEGMILGSLGNIYSSIGENKKALDYMNRALEIAEKSPGKMDELWQLSSLGLFYLDTGRYKEALIYYKKALQLAEDIGDQHAQTGILCEMFSLYLKIGELFEATKCMNEALKIAKDDRKIQGAIFTTLGISFMGDNRYREALGYFRKALKIAEETDNLKDQTICLSNIAEIYKIAGKYDQALKYQDQTMKLVNKTDNLYMKIMLLNSMGDIYRQQKEFDKAANCFAQSLAISEKTGGKRTYFLTLRMMADLHYAKGEKEKALELYKKVREFHREINDEENETGIIIRLAYFFISDNNLDEAQKYINEAEIKSRKNSNHNRLYSIYRLISDLSLVRKDQEKALTYIKKAIELTEELYDSIRIESLKMEFYSGSEEFKKQYDIIVTILVSQDKIEEALEYAERARARAFLNNLQGRRILPKNEEQKELARKEMLVSDEIRRLRKKLSQMSGMDEERVSINRQINNLIQERNLLLLKINTENPEYASLRSVRVSKPEEIQKALLPGEALIEYFTGSSETSVWCITKEKITHHRIPLNEKQVNDRVVEITKSIPLTAKNGKTGEIDKKLKSFYLQIFKPIKKDLSGINSLVIVPYGALHRLPFAVLQKDDGRYLLEDYAILTEPSASAFVLFRNRKIERPTNVVQFALGNLGSKKAGSGEEKSRSSMTDDELSEFYRGGFSPLPGTKAEVREIKEILDRKGIKNHSFIEEEFTYDKVVKVSPNAGYLHFATHGFVSGSFMGQYSGLITGDEPIFVLDVFNWNLNARMIVLSACETGLGYQSHGDDIVSLSRAFMQAGTDNLTATLWVVEDQTTRKLMVDFYENLLRGMTSQESLRQAQLKIMKTNRNPFYWGPFVLYGK